VGSSQIANDAVLPVHLGTVVDGTLQQTLGTIGLKDGGVDIEHLATSVVDGVSLEYDAGGLRVADGGIQSSHIAMNSVQATHLDTDVVDDMTLEQDLDGFLRIKPGGVTATELQDGAVGPSALGTIVDDVTLEQEDGVLSLKSIPNSLLSAAADEVTLTHDGTLAIKATPGTAVANQALVLDANLDISGMNIVGATEFASISDQRLKTNLEPLDPHMSLERIQGIRTYAFDWVDSVPGPRGPTRNIGVLAQEIQTIAPEVVHQLPNGYYTVAYDKLVPLLVGSIQALQARVDALERQNNM
jgi:hypothetical protein